MPTAHQLHMEQQQIQHFPTARSERIKNLMFFLYEVEMSTDITLNVVP